MRQHEDGEQTAEMSEEVHSRVDLHGALELEQHERKHQVGDRDFGGQEREHIVAELRNATAEEQRPKVSTQRTAGLREQTARDEGEVVARVEAVPEV